MREVARTRHVPRRLCVGCRSGAEKQSLLRFVRTADGTWAADPVARRDGRGAYLCSARCAERVKKNKKYKGLASVVTSPSDWPEPKPREMW